MDVLLWIVVALSVITWLVQFAFVVAYDVVFLRAQSQTASLKRLPKFAVGIPLRGADPCLSEALNAVLDQDYPDFELRITVDNQSDPAWRIAEEVVRRRGANNVRIEVLRERRPTCSRYASSLVQYLESLDDSIELVAFADADMVVRPDWLRHMAAALADPRVGATLGNRWYLPESSRWGSSVRYLYNAGAVVPMWLFEIPWTGALALRLADIRRAGLVEKLKRGMTEDTPVKAALSALGLRMQFVPYLTIPNREEIGLSNCYFFVERQILWTKLYHPFWSVVVVYALGGTLAMLGPPLLLPYFLVVGNHAAAVAAAGFSAAYFAAMAVLLGLVAWANRRILRINGERLPTLTAGGIVRLLSAIPVAQTFFLIAVLRCQFKRRVRWRGVLYQIDGPWDIRVLEDGHHPADALTGERMSL